MPHRQVFCKIALSLLRALKPTITKCLLHGCPIGHLPSREGQMWRLVSATVQPAYLAEFGHYDRV